jgi:hypothetical protein
MSNSNTLPMKPIMFCRNIATVTRTCFCPETGVPMLGQPALEVIYKFPDRPASPTVFYSVNSRLFETIEHYIEDGTAVMVPDQDR